MQKRFIRRTEAAGDWFSSLLAARGARTEQEIAAFLRPSLREIAKPESLPGMREALSVIAGAKRIAIYGDYDADGVCASAILQKTLGDRALVYIPDRFSEGYGLNESAVRDLAVRCDCLVTVDCGVTSVREVALARELGMRVVVTDHHQPKEQLPAADALIDPALTKGSPPLCGAGVAWKLAWALGGRDTAYSLLDLCALATIADMVPLLHENRALVRAGLPRMAARPGLAALLSVAGIESAPTSETVAFALAPRLNAAGRLESAQTALSLLMTEDETEALTLARKLDALNIKRRALESDVLEEARGQVEAMDVASLRALVVAGEGWNPGVTGLAAGRLAEAYGYPCAALSIQGDSCVGSARSANGVDLFSALLACEPLLSRFGGHKQAAGLSLPLGNVPAFAKRFSDAVSAQIGGAALAPCAYYDAELSLAEVTEDTIDRIALLEPFGTGNPAPVFLLRGATPMMLRAVGANGAHLKLTLSQNGATRAGVAFGMGGYLDDAPLDAVFTPTRNHFNGKTTCEVRISAIRRSEGEASWRTPATST